MWTTDLERTSSAETISPLYIAIAPLISKTTVQRKLISLIVVVTRSIGITLRLYCHLKSFDDQLTSWRESPKDMIQAYRSVTPKLFTTYKISLISYFSVEIACYPLSNHFRSFWFCIPHDFWSVWWAYGQTWVSELWELFGQKHCGHPKLMSLFLLYSLTLRGSLLLILYQKTRNSSCSTPQCILSY